MMRYSISEFARQARALCDHLGLDEAVVGGTARSDATLELAAIAPAAARDAVRDARARQRDPRLRGRVPPLLFALTFGEPAMKVLALGARGCRASWSRSRPNSYSTVAGSRAERRRPPGDPVRADRARTVSPDIRGAALVTGHPRDPVHPFSDADRSPPSPQRPADRANSIIELRVKPARLTAKIAEFVEECWDGSGNEYGKRRSRAASARPSRARRRGST